MKLSFVLSSLCCILGSSPVQAFGVVNSRTKKSMPNVSSSRGITSLEPLEASRNHMQDVEAAGRNTLSSIVVAVLFGVSAMGSVNIDPAIAMSAPGSYALDSLAAEKKAEREAIAIARAEEREAISAEKAAEREAIASAKVAEKEALAIQKAEENERFAEERAVERAEKKASAKAAKMDQEEKSEAKASAQKFNKADFVDFAMPSYDAGAKKDNVFAL
eukprot:scaffold2002_cov245-Chaetoceros_neogracile.AAC.10